MPKEVILVVDDEQDILELVEYNLKQQDYKVLPAETGEAALNITQSNLPDLIILDLMLPGLSGLSVCRLLKADARTSHIPIVMLTAKGEESDIVAGLELGADDYITKPFSPKVLVARVKTVLRRKNTVREDNPHLIRRGDLTVNTERHEVLVNDKPVELTLTEFKVLHFLCKRPGRVFTRYQIVDATKGDDYIVTDRAVDVQIVGLRRKLGNCGDYIETVRGVGYKFKDL